MLIAMVTVSPLFSRDELFALLVTPDDFGERPPAEILATMTAEDADMCRAIAMALRQYLGRRRAVDTG